MIRQLSLAVMAVAMLAPLSAFQDQGPYRPGNGVTVPKVTSRFEPVYTPEAKAAKIQGVVTLKVIVDRNGLARDIEVVKPLEPGLDQNAIVAVSQWQFAPGTKDGHAVDVVATIEINFKLL